MDWILKEILTQEEKNKKKTVLNKRDLIMDFN